jgi:hypothetical protein
VPLLPLLSSPLRTVPLKNQSPRVFENFGHDTMGAELMGWSVGTIRELRFLKRLR